MAFKSQRWTLANVLPIFFVLWLIGTIWSLYVGLHLLYLTQLARPLQPGQEDVFDEEMFRRGVIQTAISQFFAFMLFICFGLAVFTDPGSVPENAEWVPDLASRVGPDPEAEGVVAPSHHEVKNSGAARFCKWCNCFKPDRCHHCRVCRSCILRMDHHCPWIANCVGFRNHKHFLLLGFYGWCSVIFISVTMYESLHRSLVEETTFIRRFLVVFGMTLSVILSTILTCFFTLHVWLVMKATTTIELCEKTYKRKGTHVGQQSIYDRGTYRNICDVLGSNPLVWFIPCVAPDGDGLFFKIRNELSQEQSAPLSSSSSHPAVSEARDKTSGSEMLHGRQPPEVTGQEAANS
eukprot:TRINITY_DN10737_c1_g1_i1.p1 TRINITY_DN10737_c1_g1~~TRINITY_DN10737_c1_g1_i1.p1  ORF type:complete len:349 (-),score=39.53 TRINITY_DN10737_c1_g1_i1:74-1120(-)